MATYEQRAQQLITEAEKKLNSSKSFFAILFGRSAKTEDVAECYRRAANLFKMAKAWTNAASAFNEAAKLFSSVDYRHDAASNYVDAANCYKKFDTNKAVNCLLRAIEIYADMGRFNMAAKHHQTIAELYEHECINLERAIQHYEQAADYYRGEENNSTANKCALKVANYAAQMENYDKAITIYEEVTKASLESSLLKFNSKEYIFKAVLCHLCIDVLNAQYAIAKYIQISPVFQDSREYTLLQKLLMLIEEQNVDGFTDAVKNYDSISRLDQWYTMMLLRIRNTFDGNTDIR